MLCINPLIVPAALMFASRSGVQVHKLDSFRIKQSWKIPSSSASTVLPSVTEIHHTGPVQIKPGKCIMRMSGLQQQLFGSADLLLLICTYWLMYKPNLHGFKTHGHLATQHLLGRVWLSMYFLPHKPSRLIPLCDGHLLHLLLSSMWVSWTKSVI